MIKDDKKVKHEQYHYILLIYSIEILLNASWKHVGSSRSKSNYTLL